ncbi:MAG: amidase, partial [Paludibacter sp.]
MSISEPIIHVGILSATTIEFVLNGVFVDKQKNEFSGQQVVKFENGKIRFNDILCDELIFEPASPDASFDLID